MKNFKNWEFPANEKNRPGAKRLLSLALALSVIMFSGCKKNESIGQSVKNAAVKGSASISSQPLPGGKANYSVAIGRFATTGATWVRMVNWTFNSTNGTIAATFWQWDSTLEKGKTAFNTHTCTFDGVTRTCYTYTPTGWMLPSGQYYSMTGTYTYNTSTGALAISWSGGTSENWTISNPETGIARAVFVSSGGSGYAVTHGRGYGSNASWSTYATIGQVPRVKYYGFNVISQNFGGSSNTITPATAGQWNSNSLDLSTSTTPSSPSPANALHFWTPTSSACSGGATSRTGNVYHLSSNNNGRSMAWSHFCATLAPESTWPCYSGQRHPYAFQQVINDSGSMKGFVGIEQQDEPGSPGFQYQLVDYTTIP